MDNFEEIVDKLQEELQQYTFLGKLKSFFKRK